MAKEITVKTAVEVLGISRKTLDALYINPARAIEHEEFHRKVEPGEPDHRHRAIKRLRESRIPFSSSANTVYELAGMIIHPSCLYCRSAMGQTTGGGSSRAMTVSFRCTECQSECHLTLLNDGISFKPSA